MGGFAWVTLATNDSYSLGALVLAHSLRRVGTQHDLAVLITPGVTQSMREKLATVFNLVREVNVLDSKDEANLAVLQRPELGITFTKLHCWRLTQYDKCVFIDADALVVRNCDELFEREELSAAPDVGWPDCFNSGVFVYRPSQQTFASITEFAASQGSFDGADQGLLNMFFSDWAHKDISKHLPFIYNMCSTATYSYAPAFKQYGENVRIVHFIGATKPWLQYFDTLTGIVQPPPGCNHLQPLLQIWWNIFCDNVHPQLTDVMAASNMRTNWHDFYSVSRPPNVYNYDTSFHNPQQNTDEMISGPPDFSEFKDPWENYSQSTETSHQNPTQQTDENKQYFCGTSTKSNEPQQSILHNLCGAEPPPRSNTPPPSISTNHQSDTYHRNHGPLPSPFQASLQQGFLNESEDNEGFMEHHYIAHNFTEQEQKIDDSGTDMQWMSDNLEQISALCDLIERVHHTPETHEHRADHHRTDADNQNPNICSFNAPGTSSDSFTNDSRQSSCVQIDQDQTQTDSHVPSPTNYPEPCTDPNNIATQSELSASTRVENDDGGLAGALSRLTMGEARSEEQKAIEDHMRKQNWEQGHIDYMGRDSFDNILKKINETLSSPLRQPSPVKETRQPEKSTGKDSEVEAAVEASEVALPVLESEDLAKSNANVAPTEDLCQKLASLEVTESAIIVKQETEPSPLAATTEAGILTSTTEGTVQSEILVPTKQSVGVLQSTEQLQTLESVDVKSEAIASEPKIETKVPEQSKPPVEAEIIKQQEIAASVEALLVQPETLTSAAPCLETDPTKVAELEQVISQIVSEATTECPVPIQVAESVLQTEAKESVSEDPRPVIEAVVSSIIPPVQESAAAVSETLVGSIQTEPVVCPAHPQQLNGDDPSLKLEAEKDLEPSCPRSANIVATTPGSPPVTQVLAPAQEIQLPVVEPQPTQQVAPPATQEVQPSKQESQLETKESVQTQPQLEQPSAEGNLHKSKLLVTLPKADVSEETSIEKQASVEPSVVSETSSVVECPAKELKIPGTPTVIAPTPPTSPPLDVDAPRVTEEKTELVKTEKPQAAEEKAEPGQTETKTEKPATDLPAETQAVAQTEISEKTKEETQPDQEAAPQEPMKKSEKKMVKKSSAESDSPSSPETEGTTKKVKKVVKKVVKKPKEGEDTEEGSSTGKTKKVVKTGKKIAKTSASSSLETDKTVPETPPPSASSEAPIPPKRKPKSSSGAKTTGKKSDES